MHRTRLTVASALLSLLVLAPGIALAQDVELREAIQASVMSDPRVSEIPPEQLKILIDALVAEAKAQNMTAADILWQPQRAAVASAVDSPPPMCEEGWRGYLCELDHIFGFQGGNYEIPIILIVTSGLLIVVIWEIIAHHRKKMLANTPAVWETPSSGGKLL